MERASVGVQVLGVDGAFAPAGAEQLEVPPESTAEISVAAGLAGAAAGLQLTSDQPVTAAVVSEAIGTDALPDLAVSAATFTAGEGLAGPSRTTMIPAASASRTLAALTHSAGSLLDALVTRARSQLGTRYVFGGANPGAALDCSSFARYAMEALGVRLPRTANQQYRASYRVSRASARPGDLAFLTPGGYAYHAAVYAGNGMVWHAPRPGSRVQLARAGSSYRFGRV